MKIIPYHREHRIEIYAIASASGDRWNAGVRIRRTLSDEKPDVTTVTRFENDRGTRWARSGDFCETVD